MGLLSNANIQRNIRSPGRIVFFLFYGLMGMIWAIGGLSQMPGDFEMMTQKWKDDMDEKVYPVCAADGKAEGNCAAMFWPWMCAFFIMISTYTMIACVTHSTLDMLIWMCIWPAATIMFIIVDGNAMPVYKDGDETKPMWKKSFTEAQMGSQIFGGLVALVCAGLVYWKEKSELLDGPERKEGGTA